MKNFLFFFLIIFMLFSILTSGCFKAAQDETALSSRDTDGTDSGNKEDVQTGDIVSEETSDVSSIQEGQENIENDIMFYNSEVNFAFIYPQENLIISSCPGITEYHDGNLLLSVSINEIDSFTGSSRDEMLAEKSALESGSPGYYPEYSFEPSRKLTGISDTYVKEFLTLSGYSGACDITFDHEAIFYNNDYRVRILLSANKDKIMESIEKYFTMDAADCSGQMTWCPDKKDDFYEELIAGQASTPALEWRDLFEDIMYLLQINDFKGATAGFSRLIYKRILEESTGENYLISASYPQFQSAVAGEMDETINRIIYDQKILSTINNFKEEIYSYEDESFDSNYFLTIDYSIYMYDENGISVCFDIYPFLGGAHGLLYFETINFDLEKMEQVEMGELFVSDYDCYNLISGYCRESLGAQIKERGFEIDNQLLKNGTDPDFPDNFKNFIVSPYGLIIKFPAYQVAPYAAGSFTVNIPYSEFEDNIDPDSLIGNYNK
ncbi:MAG: DUF3298 and DUF4163 domain-containing protein [Actinomycetota bacterium]|nr:DUF3298 and DUF4163 domain-containing protein [Actinomycetota bacterium]